jgi:hypothetical protein
MGMAAMFTKSDHDIWQRPILILSCSSPGPNGLLTTAATAMSVRVKSSDGPDGAACVARPADLGVAGEEVDGGGDQVNLVVHVQQPAVRVLVRLHTHTSHRLPSQPPEVILLLLLLSSSPR